MAYLEGPASSNPPRILPVSTRSTGKKRMKAWGLLTGLTSMSAWDLWLSSYPVNMYRIEG
ncbi:hypothetical protein N7517_010606 [Penicillium concentricum]|uniref:Uncharacterized protein n=1 Tax=Penicillium concentricum TaxID=293559 RepID=A0A9W9R957_9EURO|nr:uncharacterized protein N7517_010606 [Penicillium concentricum]KAJ5355997.1 hypothetical protein N7517_010606 [Penicillium concentricum]